MEEVLKNNIVYKYGRGKSDFYNKGKIDNVKGVALNRADGKGRVYSTRVDGRGRPLPVKDASASVGLYNSKYSGVVDKNREGVSLYQRVKSRFL